MIDPYQLIEPLEEAFGSLAFYRPPAPPGQRRMYFASLADAWQIWPSGIRRGSSTYPGGLADLLDELGAQADRDVFFALSYDLAWHLRAASGIPGGTGPAGNRLLGLVAPVRWAAVYDEESGTLSVDPPQREVVDAAVARVMSMDPVPDPAPGEALTNVLVPLDGPLYHEQVAGVRDYLRRGDVYQVLIAQPVRVRPRAGIPQYFHQISRRYALADYSYWFSLDGVRVFGNCSLPHLTGAGTRLATRVFAGTQPAARDHAELDSIGALLRTDPKYYSEHVMLVDLERNDFGTICRTGSVRVERLLQPQVIGPTTYLASDVVGEAEPGLGFGRVLLANFPRGVAIGAPKLRAEEVIGELEGAPRGFYTGAVGFLEAGTGILRSNTIVTCGQQDGDEVVLRCGGGLVYRSDAEQELRELVLKLKYLV